MSDREPHSDKPLPATATFVAILGTIIVVGWLLMYELLRSRW